MTMDKPQDPRSRAFTIAIGEDLAAKRRAALLGYEGEAPPATITRRRHATMCCNYSREDLLLIRESIEDLSRTSIDESPESEQGSEASSKPVTPQTPVTPQVMERLYIFGLLRSGSPRQQSPSGAVPMELGAEQRPKDADAMSKLAREPFRETAQV